MNKWLKQTGHTLMAIGIGLLVLIAVGILIFFTNFIVNLLPQVLFILVILGFAYYFGKIAIEIFRS